jgi:archaemetzincin
MRADHLVRPVSLALFFALGGCRDAESATPRAARVDAGLAADAFAFDANLFARKHKAQPGEWLDAHPEREQTFFEYVTGNPTRLTDQRKVIVIQPLGVFSAQEAEILQQLVAMTSSFFQMPVRLAPAKPLPERGKRERPGGPDRTQYLTGVIENQVLVPALPRDALCYLGVTMGDLYPQASWNYVFGEASYRGRVGVFSLARYSAHFWRNPETLESERLLLLRAFKVLVHETGHMLSLAHCTRHECVMNGSNSLAELDSEPEWLCPVCLHKLQWNLGLDIRAHYTQLRDHFQRAGLMPSVAWANRRLGQLGVKPSGP